MSESTTPAPSKIKPLLFVLVSVLLVGSAGFYVWHKASSTHADRPDRIGLLENQVDHLKTTVDQHDKKLTHLEPMIVASEQSMKALQETANTLTTQVEAIKLAQTEWQNTKETFLPADALDALTQEVRGVREKIAAMSKRTTAYRSAATVTKKTAPTVASSSSAPFTVVGTESRGGETYLAITLNDARTLDQIVLLREQDNLGAWHLKSIQGTQAVFQVEGHEQWVRIP